MWGLLNSVSFLQSFFYCVQFFVQKEATSRLALKLSLHFGSSLIDPKSREIVHIFYFNLLISVEYYCIEKSLTLYRLSSYISGAFRSSYAKYPKGKNSIDKNVCRNNDYRIHESCSETYTTPITCRYCWNYIISTEDCNTFWKFLTFSGFQNCFFQHHLASWANNSFSNRKLLQNYNMVPLRFVQHS